MTRIHAICLAKNEGDVIAETLQFASNFCHKIYVFDTGSIDNTWQQVQKAANDIIIPFRYEKVSNFHFGLRAQVFNAVRDSFEIGDWLYILDADEFLAENPQKGISIAEREGAQQINTTQYNFHFTDVDWQHYQRGLDSREYPIAQRRRYYRFTNIEQRLFRIDTDTIWPEYTDADNPIGYLRPLKGTKKPKKCSYRIPNCHYQYRDPEQIQQRLKTICAAREVNQHNFIHYQLLDMDLNWQRYIVPSHQLNYYNNDRIFQIPLDERIAIFKERFGTRDFFRFDFLAG
ncbi:MAG: glycosyltransferase family 2 protein [Nostoc sp.]|uniref:glycosyltransferase family 2 protein n=1 Tax=Nostoc sp. TaxID=1180 RepID=UPI002FF9C0EE